MGVCGIADACQKVDYPHGWTGGGDQRQTPDEAVALDGDPLAAVVEALRRGHRHDGRGGHALQRDEAVRDSARRQQRRTIPPPQPSTHIPRQSQPKLSISTIPGGGTKIYIICTYMCICTCTYICIYVCMCMRTRVCMYADLFPWELPPDKIASTEVGQVPRMTGQQVQVQRTVSGGGGAAWSPESQLPVIRVTPVPAKGF